MSITLKAGQGSIASNFKLVVQDDHFRHESTFRPPKGEKFLVMLLGTVPANVHTRTIDIEKELAKRFDLVHLSRTDIEQFLVKYHEQVYEAGSKGSDYDLAGVELAKEFLDGRWPVEK